MEVTASMFKSQEYRQVKLGTNIPDTFYTGIWDPIILFLNNTKHQGVHPE